MAESALLITSLYWRYQHECELHRRGLFFNLQMRMRIEALEGLVREMRAKQDRSPTESKTEASHDPEPGFTSPIFSQDFYWPSR